MMIWYVVAAVLVLAGVAGLALLRKRDTQLATGSLSAPKSVRDRAIKPKSAMVGKEYEQQASKELELAPSTEVETYTTLDDEAYGVTRRQFLNRSITASFGLGLAALGVGVLKNLYPSSAGGFGSKINLGLVSDIKASIADGGGFFYNPAGRMWITEYPASALPKAEAAYSNFYPQVSQGLEAGVVALFQTCPHLGCRVPECKTSQWFECPCHGSQYNRVGEKKGGPAPRGMDRFPMEVTASGELIVDTGTIISGPPIGTNTTGQEAEGPNCLSEGGGH